MVWIVSALCLMLFGVGIGLIGLSLDILGYAIVTGIVVLAGIFFLVSFRRQGRYWGAKKRPKARRVQRLANAFTPLAEPLIGFLTKALKSISAQRITLLGSAPIRSLFGSANLPEPKWPDAIQGVVGASWCLGRVHDRPARRRQSDTGGVVTFFCY